MGDPSRTESPARPRGGPVRLRPRDVQGYRAMDELSGILICFAVVFSPWAFGTTQRWSVWTMNVVGYLVGALFLGKCGLRWWKGYAPPRWGSASAGGAAADDRAEGFGRKWAVWMQRLLGAATIALLAYTFTSAANARATYLPEQLSFEYHDYIRWLPHSLNGPRSWYEFWGYLALAGYFWGLRDWLLGKTTGEIRAEHRGPQRESWGAGIPARMRIILWVLAINGSLLALESIVQRVEGSGKLLFLVRPRVNPEAETQFGPYAYRGNAATYFNLVWPVCIGFWWMLTRMGSRAQRKAHGLLGCAAIMAACPFISTSRGGAIVAFGLMLLSVTFLLISHLLSGELGSQGAGRRFGTTLAGLALFAILALSLGYGLGWKALQYRMAAFGPQLEDRERMNERARPMARDYPLFGTGPGTFESVFQLYRYSTETYWPAQLHNDWLETRITFGWIGSVLLALALFSALTSWFGSAGIVTGRRFTGMVWLALAGSLAHARWDFPFQIYSLLFLFLVLCAIISVSTRRA